MFILVQQLFSIFQVKLILAFVVGAIIGLERQFTKELKEEGREGPGVRSFGLLSLMGASTVILEDVYGIKNMVLMGFLGVLTIVVVYLIFYIYTREELNLTTSIAVFLAFLLGVFVGAGEFYWALIISVFITAILSIKQKITKILLSLEYREITSALTIGIIGLIVLPVIPQIYILGTISLQIFFVFLLFVLVIQFLGYVAVKHLGEEKGIVALAWLGAVVHSESTTAEIAHLYRKLKPTFSAEEAATTVLMIDTSLILRSTLFLAVLSVGNILLFIFFTLTVLFAILFGVSYSYWKYKKIFEIKHEHEEILKSPLSFSKAAKFAFVLFIISILIVLLQSISSELALLAAFIGGFYSVSAVELAAASMFLTNQLTLKDSLLILIVGLCAGIINKPIYVKLGGGDNRLLIHVVLYTAILIALILGCFFLFDTLIGYERIWILFEELLG